MAKPNKAHTATANRIAKRYLGTYNQDGEIDIECDGLKIEVETTATIQDGIDRLSRFSGRLYVAVTNKEGLPEALRLVQGTGVGVMDPQGNIVKESSGDGSTKQ